MTTRTIGTFKPAEGKPVGSAPKVEITRARSASGWNMTPEEEAIFERAQSLKREAAQVIQHSQSTRKALGGSLQDHFKFLLVLGPTELDREIKSRFEAWDSDKSGSLGREEMRSAMEEMGKKPTEAELDAFLKEVDLDGNGTIDLDEFNHMIRVQLGIGHTSKMNIKAEQKKAAEEKEKEDVAAKTADAAAAAKKKK